MENSVLKLTKLALQNLRDHAAAEGNKGPPVPGDTYSTHKAAYVDMRNRLDQILAALK